MVNLSLTASRFRMRARRLFLTYPNYMGELGSAMSFAVAIGRVTANQPEYRAIVCKEAHKDGRPHFHVYLETVDAKDRFLVTNAKQLDIDGNHPNIQSVRSSKNVAKYVTKKSDYVLINMTELHCQQLIQGNSTELALVCSDILECPEDSDKHYLAHPTIYVRHYRGLGLLTVLARSSKRVRKYDRLKKWFELGPDLRPELNPTEIAIYAWLHANFVPPYDMARKTRQLWLVGPADTGKTRLTQALARLVPFYPMAFGSAFCDGFSGSDADFIVFEDFSPGDAKTIGFLKRFFEGVEMEIPVKGSSIRKVRNVPVIVTSNYTPAEIYNRTSATKLAPLLTRLLVINIQDWPPELSIPMETIHNLADLINTF